MAISTSSRASSWDWSDCNGCNLCLLACPVQKSAHDLTLTPMGRARALQAGATATEIADSIDACLTCGACEPACPEKIPLMPMIQNLRADLHQARQAAGQAEPEWLKTREKPRDPFATIPPVSHPFQKTAFIPVPALARDRTLLARTVKALGGEARCGVVADPGFDIADSLDAGRTVDGARLLRFIAQFAHAETVIADGALLGLLRQHLPKMHFRGMGEMMLPPRSPMRHSLGVGDLLVVESRAFHADHPRLVQFYDRLRQDTGCGINLDLQRIAVATGASSLQARHDAKAAGCHERARDILDLHRATQRVVVEDPVEIPVFSAIFTGKVIHLSELMP